MNSFKEAVDQQLAEVQRSILKEHELAVHIVRLAYEQRLQRQDAEIAIIRQNAQDQAHQSSPISVGRKESSDDVPDETLEESVMPMPSSPSSKMPGGLELANVLLSPRSKTCLTPYDTQQSLSPRATDPWAGASVSRPLAMSQADEAIPAMREESQESDLQLENSNLSYMKGEHYEELSLVPEHVGTAHVEGSPTGAESINTASSDNPMVKPPGPAASAVARAMLARKQQEDKEKAGPAIDSSSGIYKHGRGSTSITGTGSLPTSDERASQDESRHRRSLADSLISFSKFAMVKKTYSSQEKSKDRDGKAERVTWGVTAEAQEEANEEREFTQTASQRSDRQTVRSRAASVARPVSRATRLCSMRDRVHMFELKDVWLEATAEGQLMNAASSDNLQLQRSGAKKLSMSSSRQSVIIYRQKELMDYYDLLQKLVMHPHKRARVTWSFFGIILVMWDIITVPLLVFEMPALPVWLMLFMTLYWTLDVYMSFFTGFETNGQIEMRPKKIAANYAGSWLCLDLVTILPEWFVIFYDIANPSAVASLGDTFRLTRIFRCARLLRVLKMRHFIEKLQDRLNSEYSRAFFGILKQIVYIVIGDHFLACAWYGIGRWDKKGWVHQEHTLDMSLGYRYLTSLHWSLSQLHGTMEVHPYTAWERLFATIVLIFALLCASWIVSSVTNMMIQVQQVKEVSIRDKATLRRFLTEHNVSTALSMRVKNYADELLDRQRAKSREVNVLAQLPQVLRIDLELEIHSKTLLGHGLFHAYCKSHLQAMRSLCTGAIETVVLFQGNQLFSEGQMGVNMYFVIDGTLEYHWQGEEMFVASHEWSSEGVLWVDWVHCGEMTAGGMCNNVLAVNGEKFNEIASGNRRTRNFTATYAEGYLDKLNQMESDEINDLVRP